MSFKRGGNFQYQGVDENDEEVEESHPKTHRGEYTNLKKYAQAAIIIIGLILIVEAVLNYDKIMPRMQAYLNWASGLAKTWRGPFIFYFLYLSGIMVLIPNSVLAIALGYTLQTAYDSTLSKRIFD